MSGWPMLYGLVFFAMLGGLCGFVIGWSLCERSRRTHGVTPCDPLQATGALGYAARLADALWRKHYQQDAPNWQLCPDLLGILTQIDNMTTGLMKKPAAGVEGRKQ